MPHASTRLLVVLVLTIAVFPAVAAGNSDVPPATGALDAREPVYLALGDSIAVGDGASDRTRTAYAPLVHDALRAGTGCQRGAAPPCDELQLLNLAEGFATTTSLIETQLPAALELIERRNTDVDPGNDVVAITVDIGGFDTITRLLRVCGAGLSESCERAIAQTLPGVGENLIGILVQLRAAAGPDTRIAVMTYFNSLIACNLRIVAETAELVLEGVPGLTPGLNGVIRQAARGADVQVADTHGALGANDLVGGVDCLHPTDTGHAKIARAFVSVLLPGQGTLPTRRARHGPHRQADGRALDDADTVCAGIFHLPSAWRWSDRLGTSSPSARGPLG